MTCCALPSVTAFIRFRLCWLHPIRGLRTLFCGATAVTAFTYRLLCRCHSFLFDFRCCYVCCITSSWVCITGLLIDHLIIFCSEVHYSVNLFSAVGTILMNPLLRWTVTFTFHCYAIPGVMNSIGDGAVGLLGITGLFCYYCHLIWKICYCYTVLVDYNYCCAIYSPRYCWCWLPHSIAVVVMWCLDTWYNYDLLLVLLIMIQFDFVIFCRDTTLLLHLGVFRFSTFVDLTFMTIYGGPHSDACRWLPWVSVLMWSAFGACAIWLRHICWLIHYGIDSVSYRRYICSSATLWWEVSVITTGEFVVHCRIVDHYCSLVLLFWMGHWGHSLFCRFDYVLIVVTFVLRLCLFRWFFRWWADTNACILLRLFPRL